MRKLVYLVLSIAYLEVLLVNALTDRKVYRPTLDELNNPKIYPQRSVYGIKAIQTDDWKIEDITGNGAGGVVVNLPWYVLRSATDQLRYDNSIGLHINRKRNVHLVLVMK